jgi:hypothetical protein
MWLRKSPSTTACYVHKSDCFLGSSVPLGITSLCVCGGHTTNKNSAFVRCGLCVLSQYMHRTGIRDDGVTFPARLPTSLTTQRLWPGDSVAYRVLRLGPIDLASTAVCTPRGLYAYAQSAMVPCCVPTDCSHCYMGSHISCAAVHHHDGGKQFLTTTVSLCSTTKGGMFNM